jgi:hypothetical protein
MSKPFMDRILGVTVLADFILSEGVVPIVENLVRIGATAVACNPTVTARAPQGTGTFQPPDDAGSSPRQFDRTLFGKRSLWVQSAPSYQPNPRFYKSSPYGPRTVKELTRRHGDVIDRFIEACRSAGLKVYFQLGAVQPSGLRDEDRPCQVDGSVAAVRMADTGSLASPAIRAYNRAYVRDILARYPDLDGFRIDWPEYPCYTMAEALHDFSPHVRRWLKERGLDDQSLVTGMSRFYRRLTGRLSNDQLTATRTMSIPEALQALADRDAPAVQHWLESKAALSTDIVADWRSVLNDAGRPDLELTAHAFMPPYASITGLDFSKVAAHCDSVSPKFYTMHWPLMVQFWSDWLLEHNPDLNRDSTIQTVASWMELGTPEEIEGRLDRFRYPQPDEPHPISIATQRRKLQDVRDQMKATRTTLVPLVHGYGPLDDFATRFAAIARADVDGVWINRYGYLSDEKLDAIASVMRSEPS